jgi:hypothetical protein
MIHRIRSLFASQGAARKNPDSLYCTPRLEVLEERALMAVTDMTQLAQLFPRHSGPTTLYLNFDGYTSQGVSSFASVSGNRTQDIHDLMYRVSEIFAPFDVQVRRISGNGAMSTSGGNTTIFIGDKSGNGTGMNNVAHAYTPWASVDYPGDVRGIHHVPNSDTYDIAYVDPVSAGGTWSLRTMAGAIAHEAGHTFGLAHVLTSPSPEVMSYDAANTRFVNQAFNITDQNWTGTELVNDSNLIPKWYTTYDFGWFDFDIPNNIVTQNSYTYLRAALGAPTTYGDAWADVADSTTVDGSFVDGFMPAFTVGSTSYSTTGGINHYGDYDVLQMSVSTSKYVTVNLSQYGSSIDPVLLIYGSNGQTLVGFDDDGGGYPNSRFTFYASAGQSYRIVIGTYGNNTMGNYQLSVSNYYIIGPYYPVVSTSLQYSGAMLSGGGSGGGAGSIGLYDMYVPIVTQDSALLPAVQKVRAAAPGLARAASMAPDAALMAALDQVLSDPLRLGTLNIGMARMR